MDALDSSWQGLCQDWWSPNFLLRDFDKPPSLGHEPEWTHLSSLRPPGYLAHESCNWVQINSRVHAQKKRGMGLPMDKMVVTHNLVPMVYQN